MSKVRAVYAAMFLLLGVTLAAQDQGTPMPQPPALPATSEQNWIVKRFKIERTTFIYDAWMANRKKRLRPLTGKLSSGAKARF
jgi:hypothetical protein